MYNRNPAYFQSTQRHNMSERLQRQILAERQAAADEITRLRAALQEREASLRTAHAELQLAQQDAAVARQEAATARQEPADTEALQDTRRKLHRLAADMANLRRRQGEEQTRVRTEARAGLLREFVEILDGMDRALAANTDTESPWHQGSVALKRQMMLLLSRAGVERFGAVGEVFSPHLHEAIGATPHSDQPVDHIAATVQAGYRFDDGSLIRPARVVVSA
ncbi:MAG: molecular chaperone GrpE [Myxococcota bacterium]|jgi:molecular chaperone GrpE